MSDTVIRLTKEQCLAAGDVVARAFIDGPTFSAMFPNRTRRHRLLPSAMRGGLVRGVLAGQIAEATPSFGAVSLWTPPDFRDSVMPWLRALPHFTGFVRRLTPGDVRRFLHFMVAFEKRRNELLPEPHWYLDMLCVDPRWQGSGWGAVLALHGLERAATEGSPVIFETDTPQNVRFYEKMGCEVVEAVTDDVLQIPIWRLVCRPEQVVGRSAGRKLPVADPRT